MAETISSLIKKPFNVKTLMGTHKKNGVAVGTDPTYIERKKRELMNDSSHTSSSRRTSDLYGSDNDPSGGSSGSERHMVIGGCAKYMEDCSMGSRSNHGGAGAEMMTGESMRSLYGMFESGNRLSTLGAIAEHQKNDKKDPAAAETADLSSTDSMKALLMSTNKKILKKMAATAKKSSKSSKLSLKINVCPTFQDSVVQYQGGFYIPHMLGPAGEPVMIGLNQVEAGKAAFFSLPPEAMAELKPLGEIEGFIVIGIKHGKLQVLPWNEDTYECPTVPVLTKKLEKVLAYATQCPTQTKPGKESFKFAITTPTP